MEAIFISYRRSDTEGQAGRLFHNLVEAFGRGAVLLDVAALEKGRDFRKSIDRQLETCKVMLVVIGRSWVSAEGEDSNRRLDDPRDLVRVEIAAALRRDIPVIPVLVGGATMPPDNLLPDDIKDLVFRDGVELTHARWDSDVRLLIDAIRPYMSTEMQRTTTTAPREPASTPMVTSAQAGARTAKWTIAAAVCVVLGIAGWFAYKEPRDTHATDRAGLAQPQASAPAIPLGRQIQSPTEPNLPRAAAPALRVPTASASPRKEAVNRAPVAATSAATFGASSTAAQPGREMAAGPPAPTATAASAPVGLLSKIAINGCRLFAQPSSSTVDPNNTTTWRGACDNGLANGPGILVDQIKSSQVTLTFAGVMKAGVRTGLWAIHIDGGSADRINIIELQNGAPSGRRWQIEKAKFDEIASAAEASDTRRLATLLARPSE